MKRNEFLLTTAQILALAAVEGCTSTLASRAGNAPADPRPSPDRYDRPILKAIAYGLNAPNPHNTQAWQFNLLSDTEMLFFVDPARLLPATDLPARQIHIGCGCFLALLQTGMSSLGYAVQVRYFPNGEYTRLADIGQKPIAYIQLVKQTTAPDPLVAYIDARRTNRLAYKGPLIQSAEFEQWVATAQPAHANPQLVNDPAELTRHLDLLIEAMHVETLTYARHDESRKWFRESDRQIAEHRDGLCLPGGGTTGLKKLIAEWLTSGKKPDRWHGSSATGSFLSSYDETSRTARGVLLLTTPTNTPTDWLRTGIDYARFQLAGAQAGFYMHPMSQILQEYPEMDALRGRYEQLNSVAAPQKIQMAVRMGRAETPFLTYRREVGEFIKA